LAVHCGPLRPYCRLRDLDRGDRVLSGEMRRKRLSPQLLRGRIAGTQDSTGFHKMGVRYYAPGLMRWVQPDPIAENDLRQGNRYVFVGGDPVNATDREGL